MAENCALDINEVPYNNKAISSALGIFGGMALFFSSTPKLSSLINKTKYFLSPAAFHRQRSTHVHQK
jgi:hypothetical protein